MNPETQNSSPEMKVSIDETLEEMSKLVGKDGIRGVTKNQLSGEEVITVYYLSHIDTSTLNIPAEVNGVKILMRPTQEFKQQ